MKCGLVKKADSFLGIYIQPGADKKIFGCSSKTCNEIVTVGMGLESLKDRRDRCQLKWWYRVNNMDAERYPRL